MRETPRVEREGRRVVRRVQWEGQEGEGGGRYHSKAWKRVVFSGGGDVGGWWGLGRVWRAERAVRWGVGGGGGILVRCGGMGSIVVGNGFDANGEMFKR